MQHMANERYESARKMYQSIGVDTEKAIEILKSNEDKLHAVAGVLLEKEKITGEEFENIFTQQ